MPDGPLTSRLQHLAEGDEMLVGRKPTGTLLLDNLKDGRNLFLLGTGTGLAPFLSLVKDPETYERFERVILVHGVRFVADLAYSEYLGRDLPNDELIGELAAAQLTYYPTVTREPFAAQRPHLDPARQRQAARRSRPARFDPQPTASCCAAARR